MCFQAHARCVLTRIVIFLFFLRSRHDQTVCFGQLDHSVFCEAFCSVYHWLPQGTLGHLDLLENGSDSTRAALSMSLSYLLRISEVDHHHL